MRNLICILIIGYSALIASNNETPDTLSIDSTTQTLTQNKFIASKYFLRGLHYTNLNRPDFAASFYEKAHLYDSSSVFLMQELAKSYAKQNHFSKALDTYSKAYNRIDSTSSAEEQFYAYLFQQNSKGDSAKIHLQHAIEKDSSNIEALYQYSLLLEETKSYDALRSIYTLFVPQIQYPENYVERLALLNSIFGDSSANISLYRGAWEHTKNESYGFQLASLLSKIDSTTESIVILEELLAINPQNKNALYEISRIHIENNNFSNAAPYLYTLYSLDTTNTAYLQKLAQLEYEINAFDSALVHFSIVIKKEPTNDLPHYYMSSIYAVKKNQKSAIEHIKKAIALNPTSLLYHNHLATLYYTSNDFKAGFAIIDSLIKAHPDNLLPLEYKISALKYRIITLNDMPEKNDSIVQYRKEITKHLLTILEKDPLNTHLLFEIAASYERTKEYAKCEHYFTKLLSIDSTNHAAMNYLGYTLVEQRIDMVRGFALISKALSFEPQNIAYLDSKIWYYYLLGDYKKAATIIKQIPVETVHDEIIFEHFAKVYNKLALFAEEKQSWTKVLEIAPENRSALEFFSKNSLPVPVKAEQK